MFSRYFVFRWFFSSNELIYREIVSLLFWLNFCFTEFSSNELWHYLSSTRSWQLLWSTTEICSGFGRRDWFRPDRGTRIACPFVGWLWISLLLYCLWVMCRNIRSSWDQGHSFIGSILFLLFSSISTVMTPCLWSIDCGLFCEWFVFLKTDRDPSPWAEDMSWNSFIVHHCWEFILFSCFVFFWRRGRKRADRVRRGCTKQQRRLRYLQQVLR